MANQSWKPDIYVTDYSKTNPSNQVQQSSSESLRKQDDTSNLNSLLRVVSEFKQIDSTATLDEYKELKDELRSKSEQLQQAVKKLEVKQRESMRLRAQLQQAKKETEKYKADLKLKTEELQKTIDTEPTLTGIKSETPPDLSDPMRPLKIAEKYNELYDNEWTDAMEILGEMEKNEQINVQVLLETLKKCYNFCADLAEKQMEFLGMALVHPTDVDKQKHAWDKPKKLNIPKSVLKQMKDCRKEMSTTTVNSIKLEQLTDKLGSIARQIPNFVSKCIEICWFMCVLDPPVVLGDVASVGTTFDTNIYKPYTHSGTVVSYNVWPPLLLHIKGDLLVKGIVQPVKVVKKTTERMNINGMRETKAMKDQRDYGITYSTKRHDRLTGDAEYGDAGYDPMVDAYGRHEPVTDAYGRQYRVTKPIKTYDHSTRNEELDHYGDAYGRHNPVTKTKVSRTETLWKEHKPSSDYSITPHHQQYLQEDGYNSHRLHIRDHVESRRANIDHGTPRQTTNYVQENVKHFSPKKLVYINGVTYIELNGQLYDYELYKRVFQKHDESHA